MSNIIRLQLDSPITMDMIFNNSSGHCGGSWQEYFVSNDFHQPFSFGIMLPRCNELESITCFGEFSSGKAKGS
jgi:hypothetical protein